MDVCDVGVGDRKCMLQTSVGKDDKSFPFEFTQQMPVRVLLRSLEVFGKKFRKSKEDVAEETSMPREDDPVPKRDNFEYELMLKVNQ